MEMKQTPHTLILLRLSTALVFEIAETAAFDESCDTANDNCNGNSVVCDQATKKCVCATGFTEVTKTCKANKVITEACTAADNFCTTVGTACVGEGGSTSTTKCLCDGDYVAKTDNSGCLKNKGIGEACTAADNVCTTLGTACVADGGSTSTTKCLCAGDYVANTDNSGCLKNKGIGEACTAADNVCTTLGTACVADGGSTSTTKCLCAGDYVANTDNSGCLKKSDSTCSAESECIAHAVCSSTKCQCATDFTSTTDKTECRKNLGTSCGSTTVCADGGVCDINSDYPTCAMGSGGTCDADSKCVANSKCTETKCTCTNGEADETTKLCSSRSGGLRESSSMLVVTLCLWLSLF